MGIILLCGLALGLAFQVAILLRIAGLPARIKREIEARARADVAASELAATKRVGDELVAGFASAAEQARAGVVDLRKAVDGAAELLIEQRAYTAELSVAARSVAERRRSAAPPAPELEDDQRRTVEMERPPALSAPPVDDDEEPEELTQVASRPIAGTPAAPNGLRLTPRAAIPPPPASRRGGER